MIVRELIAKLMECSPDDRVIMLSDAEGNQQHDVFLVEPSTTEDSNGKEIECTVLTPTDAEV